MRGGRVTALPDASPELDLVQVLDPAGRVLPDSPFAGSARPELARDLYRWMVLARRLDQEAYNLQRQGELGLWLSCRGQEAAQIGSVSALRTSDHIFPAYREHAVGLYRGISPGELLSSWRGCTHGGWDPARYRMHIYSLVLATQTLHATGYAMGVQADGADEVVLAYLGDGASSQGDANEALNWAAVSQAPVIFFCQNNQWAISTPAAAQFRTPLHRRAAGFGLAAAYVDGNDALAVHAVTADAVARVRAGNGPAFIEAITYRMAGHSTSDDPRRYRDDAEVEEWQTLDPLARLAALLTEQGWIDARFRSALDVEADDLAAETRRACHALPPPALADTFRNTLVDETALLSQERTAFAAFKESIA
jgi:2-oxoisovalerate dehydrogenase E1 component alpha subunit